MARQRNGINDAYRGAVGTVIGYQWRGIWCLRARPRHVHNPRTARQQANRMLFKQVVTLAGRLKEALRKGMRALSLGQHMTEYNLFVRENKSCFTLGNDGLMVADWENVLVADGTLVSPLFTGATLEDEGREVRVDYRRCAAGERASGEDEVYLYAYCPSRECGLLSGSSYRADGEVSLRLPERWRGEEVHVWAFAVDAKGMASMSVYVGGLVPAEGSAGEAPGVSAAGEIDRIEAIDTIEGIEAIDRIDGAVVGGVGALDEGIVGRVGALGEAVVGPDGAEGKAVVGPEGALDVAVASPGGAAVVSRGRKPTGGIAPRGLSPEGAAHRVQYVWRVPPFQGSL